jgi:MFS family permease
MPNGRFANTVRALKHRNFRLFFTGQLISLIGTWMQTVAESWLVYRLTGSALLLGKTAFASQIPVFVLSPLGGIVADRFNRHRIIIATQSCAMALAGAYAFLTLTNRITVKEIIIIAACLGTVNAFDLPARQAFIVEMVGREDLINAIALNSSMFNGARIVGPAVAGLLVAAIGEGWCFAANSVSYIGVITGLLMMRVYPHEKKNNAPALEALREGFSYVKHTPPILALLMLLGLISLVAMPYSVLMPIFAEEILHSGARGLGMLMGATGLGALIAALSLASRTGVKGLGTWVSRASLAFGFTLMGFAYSRHFWLSVAILICLGFTMMMQMTASNTLIQSMVPDRLRGRVMSVYSMMFMGMAPIGSYSAGVAAHKIGAPLTLAVGGILSLFGSAAFSMYLPKLRVQARKLILAQESAGAEPPALQPMVASDADVRVMEEALTMDSEPRSGT